MKQTIGAAAILTLAALTPAQQAAAQDPVGGAIVGGALGGIIGGAVGRGAGGVIAGAAIGATTGAVIAAEAQRRNGGYYWWLWRLLLPLSERLVAPGTAGLLRVLINCSAAPVIGVLAIGGYRRRT